MPSSPRPAGAPQARSLDVLIVAHNVGSIGGMERQLAHLIEGLLGRGHTLTVIARRCELRKHERLRFVRVIGPGRPFAVAFPWFLIIASLKAHRHRHQLLHTTSALVLNRADVVTVHFCNEALHDRDVTQAKRDTILYRANDRIALWMSRTLERLLYKPSPVFEARQRTRGRRPRPFQAADEGHCPVLSSRRRLCLSNELRGLPHGRP